MFQKVFLRITRTRRFRSGVIALCAMSAIVLVALGPLPLLANPGTVTVRVDPATRAVPVNGTFTVDIVANNVGAEMTATGGLGAYEFDLVYEPDYLEALTGGVTDAGELDDTGRTVNELGPSITTTTVTTMTFGAYSHPPLDVAGPVSDTVVLASVTLQAKRAGVTTLNLEDALLADTQANAWPDGGERVLNVEGGVLTLDTFGHELGIRRGNWFYLDYNGNGQWDGAPPDQLFSFGLAADELALGEWNGDGGYELGIRRGNWFYLDYNGNGQWDGAPTDQLFSYGLATDELVLGDWNGDVEFELGIRRGNWFYLDYNGNGQWDGAPPDQLFSYGLATDELVLGDWNGDGEFELGIRRGNWFYLDYNGNGQWDGAPPDQLFSYGLATDELVLGDWNGRVE